MSVLKVLLFVLCLVISKADEECNSFKNINWEVPFNKREIIIVAENMMKLCQGAFKNLPVLHTLEINSCGITEIEFGALDNLPSLRNLILIHNDFPKIRRDMFGNLLVRKLNLTDNGVTSIDDFAFENMLNLEVLDLSWNDLAVFDGNWFNFAPKLYRIILTQNLITELADDAFAGIIKNKTKKHDLELWLTRNNIRKVGKKVFRGVDKIESLWLSHNDITYVDVETFAYVQHIHDFDLDYNDISCLDQQVLEHLHVKELDIDGNPLNCDCLKRINVWAKANGVKLQSLRAGLKCFVEKYHFVRKMAFEDF